MIGHSHAGLVALSMALTNCGCCATLEWSWGIEGPGRRRAPSSVGCLDHSTCGRCKALAGIQGSLG